MTDIDRITGEVLDAAIRLHRELGPGLLETVYATILATQLARLGYRVARQLSAPLRFCANQNRSLTCSI